LPVHRVVFPMIEQPFSIDNVVFAMLGVCFRKIPRPSRSTASPFQATTDLSRSSASPFSDQCAFSSDQRELSVFLSGFPRAKVVFAARRVVFRESEAASPRSRVSFQLSALVRGRSNDLLSEENELRSIRATLPISGAADGLGE